MEENKVAAPAISEVTLIQTSKTMKINRQLDDGTVEEVGSYEIVLSDPAFIKRADSLITDIEASGMTKKSLDELKLNVDYVAKEKEARDLLNTAIVGGVEVVDEILGKRADLYNSMLLLLGVMQQVNILNPGARALEQMHKIVPDNEDLMREIALSKKQNKRPRGY